jgi:ATP-binding protein involved in chromosome partitioning
MQTNDKVLKAFHSVKDVGSERSIVELGWLEIVSVKPPKIVVRLNLPNFAIAQRGQMAVDIRESIKSLEDIEEVQIEIGDSSPSKESPIGQAGHGSQSQGLTAIPKVKNVIAISSGKGGVGKSTVAVNLACALSQKGFKVGLLDADIYGPNTPYMLGVSEITPEVSGSGAEQKIIPIETCGIGMVSMGLLIDQNQPVIWRGPMLNGIIRQFLYQASWGERDFLIVDLPPGTA